MPAEASARTEVPEAKGYAQACKVCQVASKACSLTRHPLGVTAFFFELGALIRLDLSLASVEYTFGKHLRSLIQHTCQTAVLRHMPRSDRVRLRRPSLLARNEAGSQLTAASLPH